MKLYIIIIFILSGNSCFTQDKRDTTTPKTSLHDLRIAKKNHRDSNKFKEFEIRLLKELNKIDTIQNSSDTIVINFYAKTGKLLRIQKTYYISNVISDSIVLYFNRAGLEEYFCYWKCICSSNKDTFNIRFFIPINCQRYQYDKLNRLIKKVETETWPNVRRMIFKYDINGNRIAEMEIINHSQFWE